EAGTPEALTQLWRTVFHARVHQAFDELLEQRRLGVSVIRERVHRIGQTEFDEIRSVLKQEDLLLPPVTEAGAYVEFVALCLELRDFAPRALETACPAVFDTRRLDAAIELDIAPAALLAGSRPRRAPAQPHVAESDDVAAP